MAKYLFAGEEFVVAEHEAVALADWLRENDAGDLSAQLQRVDPSPTKPASGLAEALARVQAEIPEVIKAEKVRNKDETIRYTYADLSAVTRAILPRLGAHGLSWVTMPTLTEGEGRLVLAYKLMHTSGEMLEGTYPLPGSADPQAMGSAITYARRYCLCSVTGVAPGDDDDAAEATAAYRRGEAPAPAARQGMSQFEQSAGMAFLARPSADHRATTPIATMHGALQQALDFRLCLDEHRAWNDAVGETTWGAALAARVIDEIEHADTQAEVNDLWRMLKLSEYNPEVEGRTMASRIKERAAAIVARNEQTLSDLGERIVNSTDVAELEGAIVDDIQTAYADQHITGEEARNLGRMAHDRILKLQRNASVPDAEAGSDG